MSGDKPVSESKGAREEERETERRLSSAPKAKATEKAMEGTPLSAPVTAESATAPSEPPESLRTIHSPPPDAGSVRPRGYMPTIPRLPGTSSTFPEARSAFADPAPLTSRRPPQIHQLAREGMLLFPESPGVAQHSTGRVLVHVGVAAGTDDRTFAARAEVIRAFSGDVTTTVLERRARGKSNGEPFGSVSAPVVRIEGHADVLLGARSGHMLLPFDLEDSVAFFRESFVAGFEMRLAFENGKLAAAGGESEGAPMVQLTGTGTVVLELLHPLSALEVKPQKTLFIRRELVVGWTGRLVPRSVPVHEAPGAQFGFVGFAGEGIVLVLSR